MGLSARNDIASIIQADGKITIVPHKDIYEFDKGELVYILALYSSFARDKKKGVNKDDV